MEQALTLLMMAFQLLTVLATTPNLPPSFNETAIQIANSAIQVAREEIAKQPVEVQATIPVVEQNVIEQITIYQPPIIGQIAPQITHMEKKLIVETSNYLTNKHGLYYVVTVFYTEDGKQVAGVPVTITGEGIFLDGQVHKGTITKTTAQSNGLTSSGGIGFSVQFIPTSETVTLTATANEIETVIQAKGKEGGDGEWGY